jgi:hypothetical protein
VRLMSAKLSFPIGTPRYGRPQAGFA